MMQRIVTGMSLTALLAVLMYFGGAVLGIAALICICFAVHEEYSALTLAGHRPVAWPTWLGMIVALPLTLTCGTKVIVPLMMTICILTTGCVLFRPQPKLEDAVMSVLPLLSVVLPGLCIIGVAMVEPKSLQVVLLCLLFCVPVMCDTMALFVGKAVGGPKFCPAVSPNKTLAGAIGGMAGALLAAIGTGIIAAIVVQDPAARAMLPNWWEYLFIGLVGGVASQLGDLYASLVKRHCGVKDFSNLFPGHGGMLDRMDSVLFMAVVVFSYLLVR
ncbi:MAG: phosphatidate cytidylyltransferase [Clostridia bacterium]|nr:phosphatidate cytidylyltransferase [Clostridia bacterium]